METDVKNLNIVSKIILTALASIVTYFLLFLILISFIMPQNSMPTIMREMMGTKIFNFSSQDSILINLVSLVFAFIVGFILSTYLFKLEEKEYKILRKVLSEDERKILDEIKKAGEITQDSLRFRLGWSKAKISTILTNLDRKNLIQRERAGKTYKVHLTRFKTV